MTIPTAARPALTLVSGQARDDVDFGFRGPGSIGDLLWYDLNADGSSAGEPGIAGVTVDVTWFGGDDLEGTPDDFTRTTVTDLQGAYRIDNLPLGEYRVTVRPATLPASPLGVPTVPGSPTRTYDLDGVATPDTTRVTHTPARPVEDGADFGYFFIPIIGDRVYLDVNGNGLEEADEPGLAGVVLTAMWAGNDNNFGTGDEFTFTRTTGARGFYVFAGIPPGRSYFFDGLPDGDFVITETQPPSVFVAGQAGFYDGLDTPGTPGGVPGPSKNQLAIRFIADIDAVGFNFGENPPADPFGFGYADLNTNGTRDAGEPGIAGVAVTVSGTAFAGTPLARPLTAADVPGGALTVFTNANGFWEFPIIPPGVYSFVETQPGGYLDGDEEDADPNGPPATVGNDRFDNVILAPFPVRGPFNFGERVLPVPPDPIPPIDPIPPLPPDPSKREFLTTTVILPEAPVLPGGPNYAAFGAPAVRPIAFAVAGEGAGALVRVFDYTAGNERFRFAPFGDFSGGIRVATADLTRDGIPDVITVPGPGGGPVVRVFDGNTGQMVRNLLAFDAAFRGGLFVTAADVTGDTVPDLIVAPGGGGGPVVQVYDGATGVLLANFLALEETFRGGLRLAAGDVNGDGTADLLVTAGDGGGPRVAGFDGRFLTTTQARLFNDFFAFAPELRSGFWAAAGDVDGDGFADVAVGAGDGGAQRVVIYGGRALTTGGPTPLSSFFAGDPNTRSGVRVAIKDLESDGRPELYAAPGAGTWPIAGVYDPLTGAVRDQFYAFPAIARGGVFVG